jgi:2-succinyl-5-enolpyruvyl-6-hydroxy-3-cyclohexene-1-carboxylate synthase
MAEINTANINAVWGSLIVEELIRNGVNYFCISPGSRSTPLVAAIASHPDSDSMIHFDERGTAFHALGYARAMGRPAAVVCTSGTAVANLLPAVVEASMDMVPMILLTADRPPELRNTGANQTVRQSGIFSDYTRFSVDMPCPDVQIDPRFVLTTVDQAVYRSLRSPAGPVHLNCMFREPLAPTPTGESFGAYFEPAQGWIDSDRPYSEYHLPDTLLPDAAIDKLVRLLRDTRQGVLVIGRLHSDRDRMAALELSDALKWPTFSDILSGLRLGASPRQIVHHYDLLLSSKEFTKAHRPQVCLHIGDQIISKRLSQYLERCAPSYIHLTDHPRRHDPTHLVTHRFEAVIAPTCAALARKVSPDADTDWLQLFQKCDQTIKKMLCDRLVSDSKLSEPAASYALSKWMDAGSSLFLASSMPVRDMDSLAAADGAQAQVVANRGASGIDGSIATAAGYAAGSGKPVTMLIGDLALLHDLNSLAMLKEFPIPITIVVFNNDGGGIFSSLPIAEHRNIFEKYFATPHKMQFHKIASQFGLQYHLPYDMASFIGALNDSRASGRSSLIELTLDRDRNLAFHREILESVRALLEGV